MEKELDPSLIKATQTSLGKYVKRPPLSEKLLKKPPFRFLHDVITTVLKTTGFFDGLFEEEELISDNVKDRESKLQFLNKVISVVELATGNTLSAKPSKIVAGQEPDKTNELLQCLAQALDKKLSSDEAVRQYKEGARPLQTSDSKGKEPAKVAKKSTEPKKPTSRSNEKLTVQKKEQKDGSVLKNSNRDRVSKSKDRENSTIKQESAIKLSTQKSKTTNRKAQADNSNQQPTSNSQPNKKSSNINENHEKPIINNEEDENIESSQKQPESIISNLHSSIPEQELGQGKLDSSYTIAENDLNSSSSSQDLVQSSKNLDQPKESRLIEDVTRSGDSIIANKQEEETPVKNDEKEIIENKEQVYLETNTNKQKDNITNESASNHKDRVMSGKPKETIPNNVRPTSVRPSSSRPGAPRFRDKHGATEQGGDNLLMGKVNIIVENTPNEEEEDTSIIIVDQQTDHNNSALDQPEQLESNQHGHLVQQILDSQKEFSQVNGKTEIEWQFGAQKAREASNQEIEQVRFNILALSHAANPLGKLLDHIQEDVEVMRQELQQWTKTYEESSKELLKQKAANEDSLLPLHTKIKQLDADIKEKQDKIDDLKIVIHKNSSRIEKLLASGSVQ